jgi:UDP-N-acetylmuramyl pentapeptide phosphotransferase/UDP-N-acetylglucosamine-1-phosphate transferase
MGKNLIAVALIVLGLLYGGFTYTHEKKVVDLGPVEVTRQEHERLPISPIVGGLVLLSGVWLLVSNRHA